MHVQLAAVPFELGGEVIHGRYNVGSRVNSSVDPEDPRSPAERLVERSKIGAGATGQPLDERTRQRVRSIEAVLRGDALPRYIRRAAEIERATREHLRALTEAYEQRTSAEDWISTAQEWDFDQVNTLTEQHNAWYPIERDLPIDLRTRDYVLVNGHDYRKRLLDAQWVLERFPPRPPR
jgi:hypothetical protein